MTILTSLATWAGRRRTAHRRVVSARSVLIHMTLDACHATSLRHALSCACAGEGWTIRIAPLPGSAHPAGPQTSSRADRCVARPRVILPVPSWAETAHLTLLAEIAQRFCDEDFRNRLRECQAIEAALACIRNED